MTSTAPQSRSQSPLLENQILLANIKRQGPNALHYYELQVFDIDQAPPYAALSYVCGNELSAVPLDCRLPTRSDGDRDTTANTIPLSLQQGLESLNVLCRDGVNFLGHDYIWVDTLCIPRDDHKQKEQQILNMHKIYSSAVEVIIYFGEAGDDSAEVVAAMKAVAVTIDSAGTSLDYASQGLSWRLTETEVQNIAKVLQSGVEVFESDTNYQQLGLPALDHSFWQALTSLYCRAWFDRLWTFQEGCLARRGVIVCGSGTIEWSTVKELGQKFSASRLMFVAQDRIHEPNRPKTVGAGGLINHFRFYDDPCIAFSLYLVGSRMRKVLKDHDRVYAILGLAPEEVRAEVIVRYDTALWKVYASFSRAFMKHGGLSTILNQVVSPGRLDELPSWCPDFRIPAVSYSYPEAACQAQHIPQELTFADDDLKMVKIAGVELDTVVQAVRDFQWQWHYNTPQVFGPDGDAARIARWMGSCQNLVEKHHHQPASKAEVATTLHSALLGIIMPQQRYDLVPERAEEALLGLRVRMQQLAEGTCLEDVEPLSDEAGQLMNPVFSMLSRLWRGQVFFATKGGRFGIASEVISDGDTIVALYGQRQLYVLRPDASDTHRFVSGCHATVLSNGELFAKDDLLKLRKEFVLV